MKKQQQTANGKQQTREPMASLSLATGVSGATPATRHLPLATEKKGAPFFSIIIPVYNVAPYLRECLDSVLAQTFTDWECLCIDDGSTDGSGAILDEYAQKDARFRVFHKKNGGVSSARNLGLEKAQGQWVWFVDSDDMIHPESLGWLSTHIKAHPNVKTFSITNQCEEDNFKDGAWQPLLPCKVWEECTYTAHGFRFHRRGVATTLLKRDAIGSIRFKPFEIGEDVLFHMEIFWTWPRGLYAATPLYYYRAREGSAITSKPTIKKVSDLLTTEYEMLTLFKEHKTQWSIEKVRKYAQWNETFIWITCRAMFVRLKLSEMKQCLPLWCQVQTLQHELFGATILRKAALKLIKWTQSPFLCRWLIFPFRVWGRLRRAQHVIFR